MCSSTLQDDRGAIAPHFSDKATSNMGQLLDALESGTIELATASRHMMSQARPEAARDDASHRTATASLSPHQPSKCCEGATLPLDFSVKSSARYQSYDLDLGWARKLCHARPSPRALFAAALACYCCDGETWKASFRDAYFALRCGTLETLYLRTRDFTVLWRGGVPTSPDASDREGSSGGEAWQRPCEAWINRTSRALRKALRDADVIFTLPLDLAGKVATEDANEEGTAKAARARDSKHGDLSLARVCGHLELGGLFEVLTCGDVPLGPAPTLLAPSPFAGATLAAATVTFAGAVLVASGAASRSQERVEVSGTLLPCAVAAQCAALAALAAQGRGRSTWCAKFKTLADTAAFSRCAPWSVRVVCG